MFVQGVVEGPIRYVYLGFKAIRASPLADLGGCTIPPRLKVHPSGLKGWPIRLFA